MFGISRRCGRRVVGQDDLGTRRNRRGGDHRPGAIAVSGTIILDGGAAQGRRAITLVPDRHIIILTADQIVETMAEAISLLNPTAPLIIIGRRLT